MNTEGGNFVSAEIVARYSPMAILFLGIYIPVSFFVNDDLLSGWFQTVDLFIFFAGYLFYYRTKNTVVLTHTLTFLGIPILMAWLITGGPEMMGLWWSCVYAVWIFLLCNQKWALRWLGIFLTIMLSMVIGSRMGFFSFPIGYTNAALLNLLFGFLFTSALVFFFNTAVSHYFSLFQSELSERKLVEEKLNKLASIVRASSDAIFSKDRNSTILTWNPGAEKLFGYAPEEIIGQSASILLSDDLLQEENYIIERISSGEHLEFFETERLTKSGKKINCSINFSPIFNEDNEITSISVVLRDITVKKELEEKTKKISILEAKSKEMEEFTFVTSHDLRHPLLTILSYIELFKEENYDKVDDLGKKCLNTIAGAATRMDLLITTLLEYSRLSQIKSSEWVDCQQLVEEVKSDLETSIQKAKAEVIVGDLPSLLAYPIEMRQLFQNLLTNSLKFKTPGVVPQIKISAEKIVKGYLFSVEDNGIGIAEKDLEKIFVIFQRLHAEGEYEGLGVGLAFCKKIVDLHGGRIWVESNKTGGCTFYFTIHT